MRSSRGRAELNLEVIIARHRHAANSVGLEMLPRRRIGLRSGEWGGRQKSGDFPFRLSTNALVFVAMRSTIAIDEKVLPWVPYSKASSDQCVAFPIDLGNPRMAAISSSHVPMVPLVESGL